MSRLRPQQWGEKQPIAIKDDWSLLTQEERRRTADEMIQIIRELKEPPMQPPPLVYRPQQALTTNQRLPEASDRGLRVLDEASACERLRAESCSHRLAAESG